jgi:hypothetical protein
MHGAGGGAPKGNRNAWKHGGYSAETLALNRLVRDLARSARQLCGVSLAGRNVVCDQGVQICSVYASLRLRGDKLLVVDPKKEIPSRRLFVASLKKSFVAFLIGGVPFFIVGFSAGGDSVYIPVLFWSFIGPFICFLGLPIFYLATLWIPVPRLVKLIGVPVFVGLALAVWPIDGGTDMYAIQDRSDMYIIFTLFTCAVALVWPVYVIGMDKVREGQPTAKRPWPLYVVSLLVGLLVGSIVINMLGLYVSFILFANGLLGWFKRPAWAPFVLVIIALFPIYWLPTFPKTPDFALSVRVSWFLGYAITRWVRERHSKRPFRIVEYLSD